MKSDFESEAANSNVGMAGAQGVWNGLPVIVNYVPHAENSGKPVADNLPRFQEMAGYDIGGNYVGHATEFLLETRKSSIQTTTWYEFRKMHTPVLYPRMATCNKYSNR